MNRLLGFGLAAALTAAASATDYEGYSLTYPDGWSIRDPDASGMAQAFAPDGSANCNSYKESASALAGKSQAELNLALTTWEKADWASFLGVAPEQFGLAESHVRAVGDYQLRTGTLTLTTDDGRPMTAYVGLIMLPGYVLDAGCYVPSDRYPAYRPAMEAAVDSLRPR